MAAVQPLDGPRADAAPRPFALFAKDDAVAIDAVAICKDSGLRVPDDVAVLGVGNDPILCDFSEVPLSSIDIDWNEIVYQAAARLDRLMAGGRPPRNPLVLPPRRVVTRRTLENHFREHLHTGPAAELRRRRLEHAKELLIQTELSIAEVARRSGFETATALSKTFKREEGKPPGEYRASHRQQALPTSDAASGPGWPPFPAP